PPPRRRRSSPWSPVLHLGGSCPHRVHRRTRRFLLTVFAVRSCPRAADSVVLTSTVPGIGAHSCSSEPDLRLSASGVRMHESPHPPRWVASAGGDDGGQCRAGDADASDDRSAPTGTDLSGGSARSHGCSHIWRTRYRRRIGPSPDRYRGREPAPG